MKGLKSHATSKALLLALASATIAGYQNCSPGFVTLSDMDLSSESGSANPGGMTAQNPFTCTNANEPVAHTRRLSKREYIATISDLFNGRIPTTALEAQLEALPSADPQLNFDNYDQRVTAQQVEAYFNLADKAADLATNDFSILTSASGEACLATQANPDDSCVTAFVTKFGLRAYRRPLEPTEVSALLSLYKFEPSATKKQKSTMLITGFLQSPKFLYLLEDKGALDSSAKVLALTDFEVASRLSYLLTGSMPDSELLEAARSKSLRTPASLETQTTRLLNASKSKSHIESFYSQWLRYENVSAFNLNSRYANGIDQMNLPQEMAAEIGAFLKHITWDTKGTYDDLMLSRTAFVKSSSLAKIYEVSPSNRSDGMVTLPPTRAGLLTRAALLASPTYSTNPVTRGARLRRQILCDYLPDPGSADLSDGALQEPDADPTATTRERFEVKTSPTVCMSCHTAINPLGFAFENFDSFGRHRATEQIFDADGNYIRDLTVDSQVLPRIETDSESALSGGRAMSERIVSGSKGRACFVKMWTGFSKGRATQTRDNCEMRQLYDVARSGSITDIFKSTSRASTFLQKRIAD